MARGLDLAWRALAAAGLCALVWLSLTPDPVALADVAHIDKLQHASAYAVLAWWIGQLDDGARRVRDTAVTLVLLGVALEVAQLGVDRRDFSTWDMLANGVGVGIGSVLAPPRVPSVLATLGKRRARLRNHG